MIYLARRAGAFVIATAISASAFAGSSKISISDDPSNIQITPIFETSKESSKDGYSRQMGPSCEYTLELPILVRVLKAAKPGEERAADELLVNSKVSFTSYLRCDQSNPNEAFDQIRKNIQGQIDKLEAFKKNDQVADVILSSNGFEVNKSNFRTAGRRAEQGMEAAGEAAGRAARATGDVASRAAQATRDFTVRQAHNAARAGEFYGGVAADTIVGTAKSVARIPEATYRATREVFDPAMKPVAEGLVNGGYAVRDASVATARGARELYNESAEAVGNGVEATKEKVNQGREATGGLMGWLGEKLSQFGEWIKPEDKPEKEDK